jgi:membrane-associated phospholipid phosphatase
MRGIWQALIVGVLMLTSLAGYLLVLNWRGRDARIITSTSWDDWIPFQPAWVWVYLLPYMVGPVIIGSLSRPTFLWYLARAITTVILTLIIFIVLPTQTAPRPLVDVGDSWTAKLYEGMIAIDEPPANAAPSLHVSLTFLLGCALWRDYPRWRLVSIVGVGTVWLATLLTRQHHLIDVLTGATLAYLVVALWRGIRKTKFART